MISDELLILLRHFPTQDELDGRVSSWVITPSILEISKTEMLHIAEQLKTFALRFPIESIYCSDSYQAKQTALLLGSQLNLPVIENHLLRNINRPTWEGLTYDEIKNLDEDQLEIWSNRPGEIRFIDGETLADVRKRVVEFCVNNKYPKIVITHTTTFHAFLLENFDLNSNYAWDFKPEMYCFTVLYNGTLWALNIRDLSYLTLTYK